MEAKMLYCKHCRKAFRGGVEYCPICSLPLSQTECLVEEWIDLGNDDRNHLKKQWDKEDLPSAAPVEVYIIDMPITTCDLKEDYEIIGPVYYQISNTGVFVTELSAAVKKYRSIYEYMVENDLYVKDKSLNMYLKEFYEEKNEINKAFYIATEELKRKARKLGADAIIGMKEDYDFDMTNGLTFYLQMYGTAVKLKKK